MHTTITSSAVLLRTSKTGVSGAFRRLSGLSAAVLGLLSAVSLQAGNVSGVVRDANTGMPLPGAFVRVEGTNLVTAADQNGSFRFIDLPAGSTTLQAESLDHDAVTQVVTIPTTGEVNADINMSGSDIVKLDKYVIEGYREGRALAIQQKRGATNMVDVISADAMGELPDRNAAEALRRIPGVSMSLGDGEGQYVSIRGAEPNMNNITIDGASVAAPGGLRTGRAIPLDVMSAAQISQIQVIKTVTPDLDANALGGSINIKTTSGFDRKDAFTNIGAKIGYNDLRDKMNYGAEAVYANTFANRKFGVAVVANYEERYTRSDYEQSNAWVATTVAKNGFDSRIPSGYELYSQLDDRKSYGATLNLEWRPTPQMEFYIKPNYSHATREREQEAMLFGNIKTDAGALNMTSATTGEITTKNKMRLERRVSRYKENQDIFNISAGGKMVFGAYTIEPMLTYSRADDERPYDNQLQFRGEAGTLQPVKFDISSFSDWMWNAGNGIKDPAIMPFRSSRENSRDVQEDVYTAKIDVRRDSDNLIFGWPGFVKIGGKAVKRERSSELPSYRLEPKGTAFTIADVGVNVPGATMMDGLYNTYYKIDWDKAWQFIRNNPARTQYNVIDSLSNSIEDNYTMDEKLYALYGMFSVRPTSKLTILGGVRWEHTDDQLTAFEARVLGSTPLGIFPVSGGVKYDHVLPNLQINYNVNKRFVLRAAITNTIARPAYEDARPISSFTYQVSDPTKPTYDPLHPYESGKVVIGNPELKAATSYNYDVSAEYYMKNGGMLSAAVFVKDIKDPVYIYQEDLQDVLYQGIALSTLNIKSTQNCSNNGHIAGIELAYYQPFRFLPKPWDGFALDTNFTYIDSSVKVPYRNNDKFSLFRQPDKLGNIALVYERTYYTIRLAWNYEGEQLWTMGSTNETDYYRKPLTFLDLKVNVRLTQNIKLVFTARNLTDQREEYTYGKDSRYMRQSKMMGRDFNVACALNF